MANPINGVQKANEDDVVQTMDWSKAYCMNRPRRRELVKSLIKRGATKDTAEAFVARICSNSMNPRTAWEGEKVKLDVPRIASYKEWQKGFASKYRDWIIANRGRVFTVEYDPVRVRNNSKDKFSIVQLKEDETTPKWLFWAGDLIPEPNQEKPLETVQINSESENIDDKCLNAVIEALKRESEVFQKPDLSSKTRKKVKQ